MKLVLDDEEALWKHNLRGIGYVSIEDEEKGSISYYWVESSVVGNHPRRRDKYRSRNLPQREIMVIPFSALGVHEFIP